MQIRRLRRSPPLVCRATRGRSRWSLCAAFAVPAIYAAAASPRERRRRHHEVRVRAEGNHGRARHEGRLDQSRRNAAYRRQQRQELQPRKDWIPTTSSSNVRERRRLQLHLHRASVHDRRRARAQAIGGRMDLAQAWGTLRARANKPGPIPVCRAKGRALVRSHDVRGAGFAASGRRRTTWRAGLPAMRTTPRTWSRTPASARSSTCGSVHGNDARAWFLTIVRNAFYDWLRPQSPGGDRARGRRRDCRPHRSVVTRSRARGAAPRRGACAGGRNRGAAAAISRGAGAARTGGDVVQGNRAGRRHTDRHRHVAPRAGACVAAALAGAAGDRRTASPGASDELRRCGDPAFGVRRWRNQHAAGPFGQAPSAGLPELRCRTTTTCSRCARAYAPKCRVIPRRRNCALACSRRSMRYARPPGAGASARPGSERWRWLSGGALAGCAATVLAWVVGTAVIDWRANEDLAVEAVTMHVRATLGNQQIQVASSDRHTVKPWLSARLDYSPPVRDFAQDGFRVDRRAHRLPRPASGGNARVSRPQSHDRRVRASARRRARRRRRCAPSAASTSRMRPDRGWTGSRCPT